MAQVDKKAVRAEAVPQLQHLVEITTASHGVAKNDLREDRGALITVFDTVQQTGLAFAEALAAASRSVNQVRENRSRLAHQVSGAMAMASAIQLGLSGTIEGPTVPDSGSVAAQQAINYLNFAKQGYAEALATLDTASRYLGALAGTTESLIAQTTDILDQVPASPAGQTSPDLATCDTTCHQALAASIQDVTRAANNTRQSAAHT